VSANDMEAPMLHLGLDFVCIVRPVLEEVSCEFNLH
jgi:hypothetical protein